MSSRFDGVYGNRSLRERFPSFLENVLRIYPTEALHQAIYFAWLDYKDNDELIYKTVQRKLPVIQSGFATAKRSISALSFQREVMLNQTIELLRGYVSPYYVEIGTKGRYIRILRNKLGFKKCYLITDQEPGFSPADILERAGLLKPWQFKPLTYGPITSFPSESIGTVSIYIGVHHGPADKIQAFVKSVSRILQPKGHLIIREHDCTSAETHLMAGLAHDVFDLATGVSWEEHSKDKTNFHSIDEWEAMFAKHGLKRMHKGLLQAGDPSMNTLVRFEKA